MEPKQKLFFAFLSLLVILSISYQIWKEYDQYKTRKAIQNLKK